MHESSKATTHQFIQHAIVSPQSAEYDIFRYISHFLLEEGQEGVVSFADGFDRPMDDGLKGGSSSGVDVSLEARQQRQHNVHSEHFSISENPFPIHSKLSLFLSFLLMRPNDPFIQGLRYSIADFFRIDHTHEELILTKKNHFQTSEKQFRNHSLLGYTSM